RLEEPLVSLAVEIVGSQPFRHQRQRLGIHENGPQHGPFRLQAVRGQAVRKQLTHGPSASAHFNPSTKKRSTRACASPPEWINFLRAPIILPRLAPES